MYRYSARQFNELLCIMGCIRIGTLHDFRKSEHKRGIADAKEGKKNVSHIVNHARIDGSSNQEHLDVRAVKEFGVVKVEGGGSVILENCILSKSFDEPDCFILCTSKAKSKKTMQQFEGADSCLQIFNPELFYQLLTETLNSITPVDFRGVHEVIYQGKEEVWNGRDWGHHPALIKEPEFRPQEELRAIWQPRFKQGIAPQKLCNYKLGTCCRFVSV